MRDWAAAGKNAIQDWIYEDMKKQGTRTTVVRGILNGQAKEKLAGNEKWIYVDHAYFCRGYQFGNARIIDSNLHLTNIEDRPSDRLKKFGVKIEPWRKTGREIVIIPPSDSQMVIYENEDWLCRTESRLTEITDRPVICKTGKQNTMREFCRDAWAVVTYASVAGVEAALMGIPVFSTENCPSWPVNAGRLEDIETPEYSDARLDWACSLTYATWNVNEMGSVKWLDYHYERL